MATARLRPSEGRGRRDAHGSRRPGGRRPGRSARAPVDRAGRRGRLTDLAIDLFGGACPPVALLVVEGRRPGSSGNLVPWDEVLEVGDPILVADLDAAPPRLGAGLEGCELLKRDVLDALGLDLFALLGG